MKPLKPFKINSFEMFAITKPNAFRFVFVSIYLFLGFIIFLLSFLPPNDETSMPLVILCTLFSVVWIYFPSLVVNAKSALAMQPLAKMLLCKESLFRINYLLSLMGSHFTKQRKRLCSNKIACLINLGEFKLARKEIGLFRQFFDMEKDVADTALMFMNTAILDLYENRFDDYRENIKKAYEYRDKAKGIDKISIDSIFNESYFITAFFTDDPNFETAVLSSIEKAKKFGISAIFSRYSTIFYYYKRIGNKEKTVQYANMLLQITNGNSEIYDCRVAKEYLTNADKCN